MKKTTAQKDFEREQKNLRNRIKRLEETGYEFEDSITEMQKIKYASVSPKAASYMKVKMKKLNKEMLTQSSKVKSFTTKAGNKIEDKEDYIGYKRAKEAEKKDKAKKKLSDKELERRFEKLTDDNKRFISNFYKGVEASIEASDEVSIEKLRVLMAIEFMQKITPSKQIAILKYLNNNTTQFMSTIWDSDQIFADDNWLALDQFAVLEQKLTEYGYVVPSDVFLTLEIEKRNRYLIYDRKFIRHNNPTAEE